MPKFVWSSGIATTVLALIAPTLFMPAYPQNGQLQEEIREQIRQRLTGGTRQVTGFQTLAERTRGAEFCRIAGLDVALWQPSHTHYRAPLVVFSHGFTGVNTQSAWLMRAFADAGYFVVAPNHQDATGNGRRDKTKPIPDILDPSSWTDASFADRGEDIRHLVEAMKNDSKWKSKVDFTRLALVGHSLGGYTVLGLAGGWPSWKMQGVKAVLALSPYAHPFNYNGSLKTVRTPIMYQSGSADLGIAPFLKGSEGSFQRTNSPTYLIEIAGAAHLAWTNKSRKDHHQELIKYYCLNFLNKYVKGDRTAAPEKRFNGLSEFRQK